MGQCLAQIVAHLAGNLVCIGHNAVETGIGCEPFNRGLRPAFRHTWNVINGIPNEGEVINDLIWTDPKFGHDPGLVQILISHRIHQGHVRVDELGHILIAR